MLKVNENVEDDAMTYVDFLEGLLRIAAAYPFHEIPNNDIINLEQKLNWVIDKLAQANPNVVSEFNLYIDEKEKNNYQCKMVVNDVADFTEEADSLGDDNEEEDDDN